MVIARNKDVHEALQRQFSDHSIVKHYYAILDGTVGTDRGIISLPLCADINDRPRQMVSFEMGKEAITEYEVLERKDGTTRILFKPLTGRTHQLRVHSASSSGLGVPIKGVFIEAARSRGESMDHLFLIGPPGLGKTTIAQITAHELGADFKVTSAPALDKPKDLAGILSTITERTVFFIDEIHRLKPAIEEMLYIAMEDFELDWVIGQGAAARTVRIPVPHFTLVGATTKAGMVSSPLISRFGIVQRFSFYTREELAAIR